MVNGNSDDSIVWGRSSVTCIVFQLLFAAPYGLSHDFVRGVGF